MRFVCSANLHIHMNAPHSAGGGDGSDCCGPCRAGTTHIINATAAACCTRTCVIVWPPGIPHTHTLRILNGASASHICMARWQPTATIVVIFAVCANARDWHYHLYDVRQQALSPIPGRRARAPRSRKWPPCTISALPMFYKTLI